jgi:hypothetical protein
MISSQSHRFLALQTWDLTKQMIYFTLRCWYRYFSNTRSYPAMRFIFEMILLAWFLKIIITLPISLIVLFVYGDPSVWQNPQQAAFAARPVTNTFLALAVAPLLETMLGQWAPITLIKQWTSRQSLTLAAATLFFAGLHLFSWDLTIVVATTPIGFVLAWSFLVWQRQSLAHAIGVTAAIHVIHNAMALCLMAC